MEPASVPALLNIDPGTWLLILVSVISGAYGFAWLLYMAVREDIRELRQELREVHENDLKHLESRIKDLERIITL